MRGSFTHSDPIYFFCYSMLGWVCEVTYCALLDGHLERRGFLFGPYCPIYGFGAIIILKVVYPYTRSAAGLFVSSFINCSILEYITSAFMENVMHVKLWDYSHYRFNINGRVCLLNSMLFGLISMGLIYIIHPFLRHFVEKVPSRDQSLLGKLLLLAMTVDFIMSLIISNPGGRPVLKPILAVLPRIG